MGALKNFESPDYTPPATFPEICNELLFAIDTALNCTSSKLACLLDIASKFALFLVAALKDEKLIKQES